MVLSSIFTQDSKAVNLAYYHKKEMVLSSIFNHDSKAVKPNLNPKKGSGLKFDSHTRSVDKQLTKCGPELDSRPKQVKDFNPNL